MGFRYTDIKSYNAAETKTVRKKLGITQREFAYALGCTEVTIRNYESGRNLPSAQYIDLLHRLCRERNILPSNFLTTDYAPIMKKHRKTAL